jgi:hypothetical protein
VWALPVIPVVPVVVPLVVASSNGASKRAVRCCDFPTTPKELPVPGREIVIDRFTTFFTAAFGTGLGAGFLGLNAMNSSSYFHVSYSKL